MFENLKFGFLKEVSPEEKMLVEKIENVEKTIKFLESDIRSMQGSFFADEFSQEISSSVQSKEIDLHNSKNELENLRNELDKVRSGKTGNN